MATKHTRKLLVWAFCLHSLLVFSQATFQKTLGGPGNETATWVAEASNGFVIAGFVVGANGNQDALLIRLDASGNPIWQKRFGAGQADAFNCVVSTPDGGFLAAGETRSFGAGNSDILLVKVDEAGLVLWSKTIGDAPNDEIARCIIPTQEGGFVLSGHSIIQSDMAPSSVFLRLDASGNTIWSRTYKTGVGNLFLSNYIDGNIIYASGAADGDGAFVRIDLTSGNLLSTIAYSGTGAEALNYQQATQDGNLVIADHTWSANTGTDVELWVQKINRNNGQVLWSKVYYRPNDNIRGRIEKVNDGGFLLVPYDNFNSAQADAMLAKIDGNGNLLWSYNYGGNASDRLMKAKQTADGGFIAVGDTRSNSANGNSDILIIKTDGNGGINGSCPKGADIKSANFVAASNSLGTNTQGWAQTSTLTTAPLPLNLLSQVFSPNPVPVVTRTIPLCPNISFNIGGVPHFAPIMVVDTLENLSGSCDTIFHYDLTVSPFITAINVVGLCADETYTFNGVQYMAPATILDTIASSTGGCDTICSIVLKSWAQPAVQQTIEFCAGESVLIGGQLYSNPGTVEGSIPSLTGGCDTLVTYTLIERPQPVRATTITFCPGESVLIAGDVYDQAGTVLVNIPADLPGACDTLVIYTLELRPQPTLAETRSFCLGSSVTIAGQIYTQPGTVIANLASTTGACDTIVTYTLELLPQPTLAETRSFCPGEFVTIAGQTYTQPGTVIANLASTTGECDTIATYTLELRPQPTLAETRRFCPGESVTIAGQTYTQPGTVIANLASTTGACDTIATYTLELRPQPTLAETRSFCPGESITIAGQTYTQPGTVIANLASTTGECDTIATYTLELRPQPVLAETRSFCPGESVIIAGKVYTEPGTVIANLNSTTGGCDTLATYTLKYLTPAASNIAIHCPNNQTIYTPSGAGSILATYLEPMAASDCICPGLDLSRSNGPASGSLFPIGNTQVCYSAKDNCGQEKPCCFSVNVREEAPCDVKVNGCMKYELLSVSTDPGQNYTYKIRVTNSCSNKLVYTAIQVPDGLTTTAPANNSVYTTKEGRSYLVSSPNYSPMYSIRFKAIADSIANGQSDIFEYTLPAQAEVSYINITSRLSNQGSYEAHLNTFKCPVGITPSNEDVSNRYDESGPAQNNVLLLFPNPTTGVFYVGLSNWKDQKLNVQITNTQGQLVHSNQFMAVEDLYRVEMPIDLTSGVYFFEISNEKSEKELVRFMLQR